jgi:ABC-type proline/glycine betaine transport system permease subunit
MPTRNRAIAYIPSSALIGLLVTVFSWMLTVLLWAGDRLTLGQWPGPFKLVLCHVVSIAATVYVVTKGRTDLRKHKPSPGQSIGVTGIQAIWIAVVVVVLGSFGTWLVWGPPNAIPADAFR